MKNKQLRRVFELFSTEKDKCKATCNKANVVKHDFGWFSKWRIRCTCGGVEWYLSYVEDKTTGLVKLSVNEEYGDIREFDLNSFELKGSESFTVTKPSNFFDWN